MPAYNRLKMIADLYDRVRWFAVIYVQSMATNCSMLE